MSPLDNPFARFQDNFVRFGGGGEAALGRFLGIGGEIGAMVADDPGGRSTALGSVTVYVHPIGSARKADPFLTTGYSYGFSIGGHMFHYGGGLNYWFGARVGFRVELRNHSLLLADRVHLPDFRVGIVFH